jgi:hypothetical protein
MIEESVGSSMTPSNSIGRIRVRPLTRANVSIQATLIGIMNFLFHQVDSPRRRAS